MLNICCSIVVYKPDRNRLIENIKSIDNQVDQIIIVNNDFNEKNFLDSLSDRNKKITTIHNNKNLGIAYALNQAINYADKNKFEWIITLDQDSIVAASSVSKMMDYANSDIAIVAPLIRDQNRSFHNLVEDSIDYIEWAITSSSITNINVWKLIGGFDNNMFIDLVDYDYCKRATLAGYHIIRVNSVVLDHQLGNGREHKFFGKKFMLAIIRR